MIWLPLSVCDNERCLVSDIRHAAVIFNAWNYEVFQKNLL